MVVPIPALLLAFVALSPARIPLFRRSGGSSCNPRPVSSVVLMARTTSLSGLPLTAALAPMRHQAAAPRPAPDHAPRSVLARPWDSVTASLDSATAPAAPRRYSPPQPPPRLRRRLVALDGLPSPPVIAAAAAPVEMGGAALHREGGGAVAPEGEETVSFLAGRFFRIKPILSWLLIRISFY